MGWSSPPVTNHPPPLIFLGKGATRWGKPCRKPWHGDGWTPIESWGMVQLCSKLVTPTCVQKWHVFVARWDIFKVPTLSVALAMFFSQCSGAPCKSLRIFGLHFFSGSSSLPAEGQNWSTTHWKPSQQGLLLQAFLILGVWWVLHLRDNMAAVPRSPNSRSQLLLPLEASCWDIPP